MTYDLAGQTVVLTGATGGLGRALAAALRARGARLALLDLDLETAQALAFDLGPLEVARGWRGDVRSLEQLEEVMGEVADHFGAINLVVAGAGLGETMRPMELLDAGEWERMVDVNLSGVWRTFKAALPHVMASKGHLAAIASTAAFVHNPLQGAYPATKAGVWALCDSTRVELRHTGVTVGSIHPGFFKTPMTDALASEPAAMRLWNDHKGLWRYTPIEVVVADIVRGLERRSHRVVTARRYRALSWAPALAQRFVERFGYPGSTLEDAYALAAGHDVPHPDPHALSGTS